MSDRPLLGIVALLATLLLAPALPASDCDYEHTYLGNYPKEKEPGWHMDVQGLDHDGSRWFISQLPRAAFVLPPDQPLPDKCSPLPVGSYYSCVDPTVWRIPVTQDLSEDVSCGDPATSGPGDVVCARLSEVAPDVWAQGYNHYGDIDHFVPDGGPGYLCVPLEGKLDGTRLTGAMAFFRADDLSFVAVGEVPELGPTAAWCAVDPAGYVYSSTPDEDSKTDTVEKFFVDWASLPLTAPEASLTHVGSIHLQDPGGSRVALDKYMQGGTFSADGRVLYLTNGTDGDDCDCGIHAFEVVNDDTLGPCGDSDADCVGTRVDQSTNGHGSFNYQYNPGALTYEEPEGLTWWDLSAPDAPAVDHTTSGGHRIDGTQLHVLLLDNDSSAVTLGEDDDVYIKHYRVDIECEPQPGIRVSPSVIDFGDVDVGDSARRLLSIANDGDADLLLDGVSFVAGGEPEFSFAAPPPGLVTLSPGEEVLAQLAFMPLDGGLVTATLEVLSDAPARPVIQVAVSGEGVSLAEQLDRLVETLDEAVANGLLSGAGPGRSTDGRLGALRNMLVEAVSLYDAGYLEAACDQLRDVLIHCDGDPVPMDLVEGPAAADLADGVRAVREHIGCSP